MSFVSNEVYAVISNNIFVGNDIRPGQTVNILDTSDCDWWKGRCTKTGLVGFLPATHMARIMPGEKVHRVASLCSMRDRLGNTLTLAKNQVIFCD